MQFDPSAPVGGEIVWNKEIAPYCLPRPYEEKISLNATTRVILAKKSKRKLFEDWENEENQCANSLINEPCNKKQKNSECQITQMRFAPYPTASPSKMNVLASPRKNHSLGSSLQSPRKLTLTPIKSKRAHSAFNQEQYLIDYISPTVNLPNMVLNGKSPHQKLLIGSMGKERQAGNTGKMGRKVDWLTEMCQQKKNTEPKKVLNVRKSHKEMLVKKSISKITCTKQNA